MLPVVVVRAREPEVVVEPFVKVVVELVPEPDADWIAVWMAWRSDWSWLTCVELRPMLVRMAASSVWMADVAAVPVSVPLRMDWRSSSSWPTDACVGFAPTETSLS